MSYAKYREDDNHINDSRRFLHHGSEIKHSGEIPKYYACKYCKDKVFPTKDALFAHIKKAHNIVRPLILINGKVIGDRAIVQYIRSAQIFLYGFDTEIYLDGELLPRVDFSDVIDFSEQLQQVLPIRKTCRITFQTSAIQIDWAPLFSAESRVISAAISNWELSIANGERLDTRYLSGLHGAERLFLNGMYNYYLACRANHDKVSRYNDALEMLSSLHDLNGIGRCVLKVIAYRRNWVEQLTLLTSGESDDFRTAAEYYHRQPSTFEYEAVPAKRLYIEDDVETSLSLITLFQKHDYGLLRQKLSELPSVDTFDNPNFADQLNLLCARLAAIEGDYNRACEFYSRVLTPLFKDEYDQYRKGTVQF